jgi:hypothetical protein
MVVVAEETTETIALVDTPDPGITPDSVILWKFDVWAEKGLITITLDQEEKVRKSLRAAEERLTEMEKMLRKEKLWPAEKAMIEHNDFIENARAYIVYLDYQQKEKEFEKEFEIQQYLIDYGVIVDMVHEQILDEDLDEKGENIVTDAFTTISKQITELTLALDDKKAETKLKIKANGLSESELAQLEGSLSAGVNDLLAMDVDEEVEPLVELGKEEAEDLVEEILELEETLEEITDDIGKNVGFIIGFGDTNSVVDEEPQALVTDTSTKTKVKLDGDVTASQIDIINSLYNSLVSAETKAEIEIDVSEVQEGSWKIEKELDGVLTNMQESLLENLLLSLGTEPSSVRIKIKHNPNSLDTDEAVYYGEDENSGITTNFVIG